MKKFDVSVLTVSILILGLAVIGVSQAKEAAPTDPVVAKVGDTSITQSQMYEAMKVKSGPSAMNQLVAAELFRLEANAQGITVSDEELDKLIHPLKEKLGTPEKFKEYLASKHMTETELRQKTGLILMRDKMLDKAFPVTEEQIKAYYEKNKNDKYKNQTLEQARADIIDSVKDKNRRANIDKWLEDLRKKYNVQIMDPALEDKKEAESK